MNNKVSIGSTTIVGWLGSVLALLPTVIRAIEEGSAVSLAGPEKYLAIAGIVLGTVTQIGRYAQAHKLIPNEVIHTIEGYADDISDAYEGTVGGKEGPPETPLPVTTTPVAPPPASTTSINPN